MCLLFFSYLTTPGYRLVVAANRDEFLVRPTAPLAFLDPAKTIMGGLDLQAGGTWLGITARKKFAAITNYRDPATNRPEAPSRGRILMNYLTGDTGAGEYLKTLATSGARYNGFNLILGDAVELFYYSNKNGKPPRKLGPGFYGLSNRLLDSPWPKVAKGKDLLRPHMVETAQVDPLQLLSILEDRDRPPDDSLPDTGVGIEWERLLSPIFIDSPSYGTRSSAVITVSEEGIISFTERTHRFGGKIKSQYIHLTMNGSAETGRAAEQRSAWSQ